MADIAITPGIPPNEPTPWSAAGNAAVPQKQEQAHSPPLPVPDPGATPPVGAAARDNATDEATGAADSVATGAAGAATFVAGADGAAGGASGAGAGAAPF